MRPESPLKMLRKKLDYTEDDLAVAAGVSQSQVSRAERGVIDLGEKIEAFLQGLGEDIRDLKVRHLAFMKETRKQLREGGKASSAAQHRQAQAQESEGG